MSSWNRSLQNLLAKIPRFLADIQNSYSPSAAPSTGCTLRTNLCVTVKMLTMNFYQIYYRLRITALLANCGKHFLWFHYSTARSDFSSCWLFFLKRSKLRWSSCLASSSISKDSKVMRLHPSNIPLNFVQTSFGSTIWRPVLLLSEPYPTKTLLPLFHQLCRSAFPTIRTSVHTRN